MLRARGATPPGRSPWFQAACRASSSPIGLCRLLLLIQGPQSSAASPFLRVLCLLLSFKTLLPCPEIGSPVAGAGRGEGAGRRWPVGSQWSSIGLHMEHLERRGIFFSLVETVIGKPTVARVAWSSPAQRGVPPPKKILFSY